MRSWTRATLHRCGLGSLLLLVIGLASVSAAPRAPGDGDNLQRMLPPRNSVRGLEKYIAWRRQHHLKVGYLDAYLWRLRQRAYPYDRVDASAYYRAVAHRETMRPATLNGSGRPSGIRALALPQRWEFLGPNNLASPAGFFGFGPFSGRINAIAVDPTTPSTVWVAGATGGVWKSTNNGQTWTFLSGDWPALPVSSIAIHPTTPSTVYVGTGDYNGDLTGSVAPYGFGIMKTTDGGATWTNVGKAEFSGFSVRGLLIDPETPTTIIATAGRGTTSMQGLVYRSTNGGQNWTPVINTRSNWANVVTSARSGSGARTSYAVGEGTGGQVWKSTDRGATWTKLTTTLGSGPQQGIDAATSPTAPDTVYLVSGTDQKIYKSTDAGANWTDTTNNFPVNIGATGLPGNNWLQSFYDIYIGCTTRGGQDVVVVGLIDVAHSIDGGATWQSLGKVYESNALIHPDQHSFARHPTNPLQFYVGGDGGIYRGTFDSAGTSANFSSLNGRLGITQFYHADFHPTDANRMIGGTQDNSTPAAIGDLNNWDNVTTGDGAGCAINPQNPSIQYGSTQSDPRFPLSVYRTSDQWTTRTLINPTFAPTDRLPFIGEMELDPTTPTRMYIGSNFLNRWDDSTLQWTMNLGNQDLASPNGTVSAIAVAPSDSNIIYTGSTNGLVFMTRNAGTTWTQINSGSPSLPNRSITSIAVHPTNPNFILVGLSGTGTGHLWRLPDSSSGARTWQNVSGFGVNGLPDIPLNTVAVDPTDPIQRWFAGTDIGVFRTTNAGTVWENATVPLGLPNVEISKLKVIPGTGFLMAATYGRGMWRIDPNAAVLGLNLLSPKDGDSVPAGQPFDITWTSIGFSQPHNIKIELSRDGGVTFPEVITASTPDIGTFSWIPQLPVTSTARIRITSVADPTISDRNAANFSIVSGSLVLTKPNGGELFRVGNRINIEWTATDFALTSPKVRIEISRNGGGNFNEVLFASVDNDGQQTWTVTGPVTTQARIRVVAVTLPSFRDASDADFEIRAQSTLHVDSPNGGESFVTDQTIAIAWTAAGFQGNVKIEFSRNGGGDWVTIFPDTPNDGSELWQIRQAPTRQGRIRISSVLEPATADVGDGLFEIQTPTVRVSSPGAARSALLGTTETIRWTTTGILAIDSVNVELSRDGGTSWETIDGAAENSGSLDWNVIGAPTNAAVVRVSSNADAAVFGISGTFKIVAPTLFLVTPNGREKWRVGDQQTIQWSGTSVGSRTVDVELSRDGGRSWELIVADTPNDGAYQWGVQGATTQKALVRVTWTTSGAVRDQSDRVFGIVRAPKKGNGKK